MVVLNFNSDVGDIELNKKVVKKCVFFLSKDVWIMYIYYII